jgi:probable rRNA maturation factor
MREIDVNDLQSHLADMTRRVVSTLRHVLRREGVERYRLSVALVDDRQIRRLNRRYLDHDYATDVLSFRLDDEADDHLSGEIIISAEQACRVAGEHGADAAAELLLYAVHGCLHLTAFDDQSPAAARAMHARESELLAELGYTVAVDSADTQ